MRNSKTEEDNEDERQQQAFQWYKMLAKPTRIQMHKIVEETSGMVIKIADIDLLPWNDDKTKVLEDLMNKQRREKMEAERKTRENENERRIRAYYWYKTLANPKRSTMHSVVDETKGLDITKDDVDLMPWNSDKTKVLDDEMAKYLKAKEDTDRRLQEEAEEAERRRKGDDEVSIESTSAASGNNEDDELSDEEKRRQRAYHWYELLAKPTRATMHRVVDETEGLDITTEDVDLLNWNADKTKVLEGDGGEIDSKDIQNKKHVTFDYTPEKSDAERAARKKRDDEEDEASKKRDAEDARKKRDAEDAVQKKKRDAEAERIRLEKQADRKRREKLEENRRIKEAEEEAERVRQSEEAERKSLEDEKARRKLEAEKSTQKKRDDKEATRKRLLQEAELERRQQENDRKAEEARKLQEADKAAQEAERARRKEEADEAARRDKENRLRKEEANVARLRREQEEKNRINREQSDKAAELQSKKADRNALSQKQQKMGDDNKQKTTAANSQDGSEFPDKSMTREAKILKVYAWHSRLARPSQKDFKRRIAEIEHVDITPDDVDMLPWNYNGTQVNVAHMTKLIATGKIWN